MLIAPDGVECREINGFPDYFIGANGVVWSARTKGNYSKRPTQPKPPHQWDRLSLYRRPYGARYFVVCMRANPCGIVSQRYIHRLVLEAFAGPCPDGMLCCHGDGDTSNNRIENLRWDTPQANAADAKRHGRRPVGEALAHAKLTEQGVRSIRSLAKTGAARWLLAACFGVSIPAVYDVINRRRWNHVCEDNQP